MNSVKSKKRSDLVDLIRGKIWSGEWASGQLLPPRVWFEQEFGAAPITVQRGFQKLLDQGLLTADRRRGTRVCDQLPHLSRYAVVTSKSRYEVENCFIRSLKESVRLLAAHRNLDISFFELPGVLDGSKDHPKITAFAEQLNERLFAGALFIDTAFFKFRGALPANFPTPCCIMNMPGEQFGGIRIPHEQPFYEKLFPLLPRTTHNRIAFLLPSWTPEEERHTQLMAQCARFGYQCPPGGCIELNPVYSPHFAAAITELLFAPDRQEPPEIFFVGDDNFLPHVIDALRRRFGNRAEEKVILFSHANFPLCAKSDFPVHYLGLNLLKLLTDFIRTVDAVNAGEPDVPAIPPEWCTGEEFHQEEYWQ